MATDGERPARITLEAPSAKLEADLRDVSRVLQRFTDHNSRILDRARDREESKEKAKRFKLARLAGRGIARFGTGFVERAGAGVAELAAQGYDETLAFEKGMARFAIAAGASTQQTTAFRMSLSKLSKDTGIARGELLSGAASYVALTGDADGARQSVDLFSRVALASGASMTDIAETAASMRDNLKIAPKDFEAGFSALIVQGKAGSVELKDLARELSGVAPQFAAFKGGGGAQGLATLGAALQAGRKGFGTASETATGLRALMVAIQRNADKLGKSRIFTRGPGGKKELRGFREIIDGIATSALAKDPTLLTKAFGSDEAKRMFDQLVQNKALFDELESKSAAGTAVRDDSLAYLESPAAKLEKAMNQLKLSVAEAFTPARIELFASAVERVARGLSTVVEFLDNISEFGDVRKQKEKNDHETAMLGSYTGDDRYLQGVSANRARVLEQQGAELRARSAAERARRVAIETGPGLLSLGTQSIAIPAPVAQQSRLQSPVPHPAVIVEIDGNAVASAIKKSSGARRNVGGR